MELLLKQNNFFQTCAWWFLIMLNLAVTFTILDNSLPYFDFTLMHNFLYEKGAQVREPLWRTAFYVHIAGGLVCLVTGPLLLSRWALNRSIRLHKILGATYVFVILGLSGPGGIYLAFFAKGGFFGVLGFLLLGSFWMGSTLMGYLAIRKHEKEIHLKWMCRSFAFAASAVSFRVFQGIIYFAMGVSGDGNYVASIWLSFVFSLFLGEWIYSRKVWKPKGSV
jgi:hypothetical protein